MLPWTNTTSVTVHRAGVVGRGRIRSRGALRGVTGPGEEKRPVGTVLSRVGEGRVTWLVEGPAGVLSEKCCGPSVGQTGPHVLGSRSRADAAPLPRLQLRATIPHGPAPVPLVPISLRTVVPVSVDTGSPSPQRAGSSPAEPNPP